MPVPLLYEEVCIRRLRTMTPLTSEPLTKYTPWFWITLTMSFLILSSLFWLPDTLPDHYSLWIIGFYGITMMYALVVSRRKVYCRRCGSKVHWDTLFLPKHDVQLLIEEEKIKRPFQYGRMVRSNAEWHLDVLVCEHCHFQRVIAMRPMDWD